MQADCPVDLTPLDEAHRLAALQALHILDTSPETDFDALTRVAAHALNTPIAVIGLMDSQRLWFKARLGLDLPELDRQVTICSHAITQPGRALIVPDLRADPRFADNPLVTHAPHLRAYAGAPLVDASGAVLGTLAVLDTRPRDFGPADAATLLDLARLVMCALEARHRALMLQQLAMTDHLTGLANRAHFERALEAEFGRAVRMGEPFTLLLLDLDGFKAVNDGFGHGAGDETLREVSQRLMAQVRSGDVLARLGGDEFGIVMRDGPAESAQALARRIVRAVSQPIRLSSGDEVGVGVSVGMAAYADDVMSVRKLVSQADQALYEAKKQNERRWKMFVGMRA
jgi:diguanylate cyclase (GGDEF)-like protein